MSPLTPLSRALRLTAGLAVLALALVATPGTAQEPIVFGVIGDSGEVSPGLRGVVREMAAYRRERANFDFVLHARRQHLQQRRWARHPEGL